VARGERIFNTRTIPIADVPGLNGPNDKLAHLTIPGTCTTCHDSPNVGNHSVSAPLDIGINAAARRTRDLPLFTLRCNATGATVQTLDPGRAMVTGKCADIGKVKGPILRGLAARAPYFHNGSAATLMDTVNFYDGRFNLGLSDQDKEDLVAFLRSL
jgi:cytochrome c peroxidase